MDTIRSVAAPAPHEAPAMSMDEEQINRCLLDARAFHVFEFHDKRIFYDVRTGVIAEVTDAFVYDLLAVGMRYSLQETAAILRQTYPGTTEESIREQLKQWTNAGLLQYEDVPEGRADEIKSILMWHNPRRIQLFISQACNLRCIYCYAEDNGSNAVDRLMSFEEAKQAIDHLVKRSRRRRRLTVQFFGGEPLMNFPVMKEVVAYCRELEKSKNKRFYYQISTNATLLTEEMMEFIVEHEMGTLVSIDGDEELHNYQRPRRGGGGSWEASVRKGRQLDTMFRKRNKWGVKARANITKGASDPVKVSEALAKMGFTNIGISTITARPGQMNELTFTAEEYEKWRGYLDALALEWLDDIDAGRPPRNPYAAKQAFKGIDALTRRKQLGMIRCGVGRNTNAVDVDGNIYPCHRYVGLENYIMGNTRDGLDEAKVSSLYEALIHNSLTHCRNCWARAQCGGICPWEMAHDDGSVVGPAEEACVEVRHHLAASMYLFARLAERHPERLKRMTNSRFDVVLGHNVSGEDADREEV